jgi:hypothetical protein
VREYFPPREAGVRTGIVLMATLFGMAFGGWVSGAIFFRRHRLLSRRFRKRDWMEPAQPDDCFLVAEARSSESSSRNSRVLTRLLHGNAGRLDEPA